MVGQGANEHKEAFLNWVPIFRTGTHTDSQGRSKTWTNDDLDTIVSKYNRRDNLAPLVLGHPQNNAPVYGWVRKLRRSNNLLEACFERVSNELKEAVRRGHYKYKSISLYADGSLKHVGLLGAAQPAVTGLGPIVFSDDDSRAFLAYDEEPFMNMTKYV